MESDAGVIKEDPSVPQVSRKASPTPAYVLG
jgi:hypothetical protein